MDPMVEEVISQVAPAKGNAIGMGNSLGGVSVSWPRLRNRIYSRI